MSKLLSFVSNLLPSKAVIVLTLATVSLISYLLYSLSVAHQLAGIQAQTITQLEASLEEVNGEIDRLSLEHQKELVGIIETTKQVQIEVCKGQALVDEIDRLPTTKPSTIKSSTKIAEGHTGVADIDDKLPDSILSILERM